MDDTTLSKEELYKFMDSRGVEKETINHFKSHNIDCEVVKILDSSGELATLLPAYGDRIAIVDFCVRKTTVFPRKKQGLIDKIKLKIKNIKDGDPLCHANEILPTDKKRLCTAPNTQSRRQIEIGWYLEKKDGTLTQVRTKQGGGTRKVKFLKNAKKDDILRMAVELFFPNGNSPIGNVKDFECNILDFKQNELDINLTVGQLYDITKLSSLRFYLSTRTKATSLPSHTTTSGDLLVQQETPSMYTDMSGDIVHGDPKSQPSYSESCRDLLDKTEFVEYNDFDGHFDISNRVMPMLETEICQTVGSIVDVNDEVFTEPVISSFPIEPPLHIATNNENNCDPVRLIVHRGQVLQELIEAFKHISESCTLVTIEMILPNGEPESGIDAGGVFRDCITEFWTSFYEKCTVGTNYKIPYLRHDYSEEEWCSVGKILKLGWVQANYWPIKLAPPCLEQCIFGEVLSDLSYSFLQHVSLYDKEIIEKAMNDFDSVDKEELLDVFDGLQAKWIPSSSNISKLIFDIAHKEIIQKPKFVLHCWEKSLNGLIMRSDYLDLRDKLTPTPKNILKMLLPPKDMNQEQNLVYGFLKKFVREADYPYLFALLRFSTGADIVTNNIISVTFSKADGLARTPVSHVCGCVLELPTSYKSFPDFRCELNSLLSSNIWIMDIV